MDHSKPNLTVNGRLLEFFSKNSNGRIEWNISWPRIISTSPYLYLFRENGSRYGYWTCNDSKSFTSIPTTKSSLTFDSTTKARQEPPEWTGVNFNSKICTSVVWCEITPWSLSFKGVPCTFNFLEKFSEIHVSLHAVSPSTRTFLVLKDDCKLTSVIYNGPLTFVTEGMPGLSSVLFGTAVILLAVVSSVSSVFSRCFRG